MTVYTASRLGELILNTDCLSSSESAAVKLASEWHRKVRMMASKKYGYALEEGAEVLPVKAEEPAAGWVRHRGGGRNWAGRTARARRRTVAAYFGEILEDQLLLCGAPTEISFSAVVGETQILEPSVALTVPIVLPAETIIVSVGADADIIACYLGGGILLDRTWEIGSSGPDLMLDVPLLQTGMVYGVASGTVVRLWETDKGGGARSAPTLVMASVGASRDIAIGIDGLPGASLLYLWPSVPGLRVWRSVSEGCGKGEQWILTEAKGDGSAGEEPEAENCETGSELDEAEAADVPANIDEAGALVPPGIVLTSVFWGTLDEGTRGVCADSLHNPAESGSSVPAPADDVGDFVAKPDVADATTEQTGRSGGLIWFRQPANQCFAQETLVQELSAAGMIDGWPVMGCDFQEPAHGAIATRADPSQPPMRFALPSHVAAIKSRWSSGSSAPDVMNVDTVYFDDACWSGKGDGQWVQYDLGPRATVYRVETALYLLLLLKTAVQEMASLGDHRRQAAFDIELPSGTTAARQSLDIENRQARIVPILGHGKNDSEWNSLTEAELSGWGHCDRTTPNSAPVWNSDRRELHFCGAIVKRFKKPSPNQERILDAFEEQCWPERITDPLPRGSWISPGKRLRDAIKRLNASLQLPLLHFAGDGTGRGVRWRSVAPPSLDENLEAIRGAHFTQQLDNGTQLVVWR